MKFAIITDSHIGPCGFYRDTNRIMSHMSEKVICELAAAINTDGDISFVAQLGDMSQDDVRYRSVEFDRANFVRALWYFKKFSRPVYHCVGNHDRESLTYGDLCQLLGYPNLYFTVDVEEFSLIFLYTRHYDHQESEIEAEQLDWLRETLARATKKCIIFSHHSFADQDLKGNFWFDGTPHRALVSNRSEVRAILESSKKVIAAFNGHLHWNNMTVHNGIPYFTIQSCVEDVNSDGVPSKSYAIVSAHEQSITVQVSGLDSVRYEFSR